MLLITFSLFWYFTKHCREWKIMTPVKNTIIKRSCPIVRSPITISLLNKNMHYCYSIHLKSKAFLKNIKNRQKERNESHMLGSLYLDTFWFCSYLYCVAWIRIICSVISLVISAKNLGFWWISYKLFNSTTSKLFDWLTEMMKKIEMSVTSQSIQSSIQAIKRAIKASKPSKLVVCAARRKWGSFIILANPIIPGLIIGSQMAS